MVRKIIIISLLLVALLSGTFAAGNGGYRSPFAIGFGARQLGMGGASVANINSSSSIYWNPAGLANVDRSELQLFHMNLFMDTRYEFVAAAYPTLSMGAFGVGVGDLSSGDFEQIDDFVTTGTFSSRQDMFMVGYGFAPFRNLAAGLAVKGVYYDLADYKDTGFGFDFGLIYSLNMIKGISLGLKASDIAGPRIKLNTVEQRLPFAIRGGLAYEGILGNKHSLIIDADIENTENLGTDIYAGAEFGFNKQFFARLGYMGDKLTMGAGIEVAGVRFDYAYTSLTDLETSHRLSLSYAFGASKEAKQARRDEMLGQRQVNEYKNQETIKNQDKIQKELETAQTHEQKGEIYQAIEAYYRVLGLDVQNQEAISKVTILFDQIRQDLVRDANKGYTDQLLTSQLNLGDSYFNNKQYDNATDQYNLSLILDPNNQHAKDKLAEIDSAKQAEIGRIRTRAQAQMQSGAYEQALESLSRILQADPNDTQAKADQDRIFKVVGASKYLDRALRYFDQSDYNRAIELVDSSLALNPDSEGAKGLKRQLNRYTAEVTTVEDIKKNDAHWQIYLQGMEKYQAGEYKEAIRLWQSLQEFYPNNPNLSRNIDQAAERSDR